MVMSTLPHAAQLRVVRVVVVLHSFPAHHRRQCREKSGGRDRGCWVKSGKIARCPTLSLLGEDEPVDVFGHASVLIDFVTMGSKRGHSELELRGRQARQERVPPQCGSVNKAPPIGGNELSDRSTRRLCEPGVDEYGFDVFAGGQFPINQFLQRKEMPIDEIVLAGGVADAHMSPTAGRGNIPARLPPGSVR